MTAYRIKSLALRHLIIIAYDVLRGDEEFKQIIEQIKSRYSVY